MESSFGIGILVGSIFGTGTSLKGSLVERVSLTGASLEDISVGSIFRTTAS